MTQSEQDHAAALRICNGNQEAFEWIQLGRMYVHEIDDLIDEDMTSDLTGNRYQRSAQRVCRIGAIALDLYTHPFWMRHWPALKAAMMLNTINYADSVAWESADEVWKRQFSDWARHFWLDVCLVVAQICGGYDHAKAISQELRTVSWCDHHTEEAKPH